MDPLPCNTWLSRRRSDSARLGRPRYTMTGRNHDPVPNRHLRPGDLVGAPTGRAGRDGTAVRLRPRSSDRGYGGSLLSSLSRPTRSGRLGTTDQDACSVWAQGAGGADKVRRSSQPQYRGPYPVMPCAPAGRCYQATLDKHYTTFQMRQSTNNTVGIVVCRL